MTTARVTTAGTEHLAAPAPMRRPDLRTGLRRRPTRGTLLIFSQVFVPDPASVGQHIADVAAEMARRGYRVRVYTANRGYDDPTRKYPPREILRGIDVRRLPLSSFGKKSLLTRVIGTASFMIQVIWRGLFTFNLSGVLFSTSPPLIGFAATVIRIFRTVPTAYWAMDLNPDQLIALGKLTRDHPIAAFLESANRMILRNASLIVALDRFMAERLYRRGNFRDKLVIIPPWPHETFVEPVPHDANPFRAKHNLAGKFVIMYSGNHSPSNPLDTLLKAAVRFRDDPRLVFMFIGGGIGKKDVEDFIRENQLSNCICLPYQPLEDLRYSLSAADVHVVSLGQNMVGIIHPCKVYGAMAVGRPVLYFGPRPSHIADLLDQHNFGLHVSHGDIDAAVAAIDRLRNTDPQVLAHMGRIAQNVLHQQLSQELLCGRFCDGLELILR
ncbi:glycosyltransferase family 4 protein [Fontivita pretiosa]|uniref:glycosyltransferase family 4 protein n=1 Tax=Fontivita pretiosa TaxID=2989684 RepID=UPI003D187728